MPSRQGLIVWSAVRSEEECTRERAPVSARLASDVDHALISSFLRLSMGKEQELIVITKTYDLILWSCNHTSKFPRNHRFVLGERIERYHQAANVRSANRNRNAPSNRNTNNGFRPSSTWR